MKTKFLAAPYILWMALFSIIPLCVVLFFAFTDLNTGAFTIENIARLGDYLPIFAKSVWLALVSSFICQIGRAHV